MVGITGASPYLQLVAVCLVAACDVQAFVAKNLDRTACEGPFLSVSFSAGLDSDTSSVDVGRGSQTLGCVDLLALGIESI